MKTAALLAAIFALYAAAGTLEHNTELELAAARTATSTAIAAK